MMYFLRTVAVVLAAALSTCCAGEDGGVVGADTRHQEETPRWVAEIGEELPEGALPDLTGRAYRIYELFATQPTDQVNETWGEAVAIYSLVIIFRVVSHDVGSGQMVMEVASAWSDRQENPDGSFIPLEYRYGLDPVPIQVQLDGSTFQFTEPFELDLFTPIINKPFHIAKATGHGKFSPDGSKIAEVFLDGFLPEADTVGLCVDISGLGIVNLHWFFNVAHICPDADLDGDGTLDSYNFKGIVRGVDETYLFVEGIHAIESGVEVCDINDEPCF
jgi:hypothetical protein